MKKLIALLFLVVVSGLCFAQDNIVASVDGMNITADELALEFQLLPQQQAMQLISSNEGKAQVLETIIRRKLLLRAAQTAGIDTLPGTKLAIARQVDDVVLQVMLQAVGSQARKPTEEEIKKVYDENDSIFYAPDAIHVLRIVNGDKDAADIAKASLKGGIDFETLMKKTPGIPEAPSGDIGFLPTDDLVPDLKAHLEKLNKGDISDPVQIGQTWQIFKVVEKRKAGTLPLEDVKMQINNSLQQQLSENTILQYQDNLLKEAEIKVNQELLGKFGQPQNTPAKGK